MAEVTVAEVTVAAIIFRDMARFKTQATHCNRMVADYVL